MCVTEREREREARERERRRESGKGAGTVQKWHSSKTKQDLCSLPSLRLFPLSAEGDAAQIRADRREVKSEI